MFGAEENKKLADRHKVLAAWEAKYGEPVSRVIANFLLVAPPDQIIKRFGACPDISPQEIGLAADAANVGDGEAWSPVIGWEEGAELHGDPKSLAAKMAPIYRAAFEEVRKRKPTAAELECEMAVGKGESGWGTHKYPGGLGPGMHNHGAIQCHKGCTDENSFQSSDTHPQDTGGSVGYAQRFRRYPTDKAGVEALVKTVGNDPLRMLAASGNMVAAFSLGMFGNRYYEMFNAPPATIKAHQATYDWIRANATKPPSGTSDTFRTALLRAKDPIWAGRVLMHSIAISKHIDSTCKALGVRRATKFDPPIVTKREVIGTGAGALIGLATGTGPLGAAVGALVGLVAGRATR